MLAPTTTSNASGTSAPQTGTATTDTTPNIEEASATQQLGPSQATLRAARRSTPPTKANGAFLFGQDITETRARKNDSRSEGFVGYLNMSLPNEKLSEDSVHTKGTDNIKELLETGRGKTVTIGAELKFGTTLDNLAAIWDKWEGLSETDKSKGMLRFLRTEFRNNPSFEAVGNLLELGRLLAENPKTNVELRPGYEIDGAWNGYDQDKFKKAFRLMSSFISKDDNGLGLKNVDLVLQTAAYPVRQQVKEFDVYSGQSAEGKTIAEKQGMFQAHLDSWNPGDEYWDTVGISMFRSDQSHKLYNHDPNLSEVGDLPLQPDGTGDIQNVLWDGALAWAKGKSKKFQVSELTPKAVYANRERFNAKVDEYNSKHPNLPQLPYLREGEVAVSASNPDEVPIEQFFDGVGANDKTPHFKIITTQEHYDAHIVPMANWIANNRGDITSVNVITSNWDSFPGWSALQTGGDSVGGEDNWGLGMTDYQINAFVSAINNGTVPALSAKGKPDPTPSASGATTTAGATGSTGGASQAAPVTA